jgi:Crp-like helix-turn-helix domain/FG-GAP repeat
MTATESNSRRARTREARLPFILIMSLLFSYTLPSLPQSGHPALISVYSSSAEIIPSPPGPDVTIIGPATLARLGGSGSPDNLSDFNHSQPIAVGDFNGDGIDDIAIAALDAQLVVGSTLRSGAGVVYLIFGRKELLAKLDTATRPSGGVGLTILGAADGDRFERIKANALALAERLYPRLAAVEAEHYRTIFQPAESRVAALLLELAGNGSTIEGLTQRQLGERIGLVRETVVMVMASLKAKKLIGIDRRKVVLFDKKALSELSRS